MLIIEMNSNVGIIVTQSILLLQISCFNNSHLQLSHEPSRTDLSVRFHLRLIVKSPSYLHQRLTKAKRNPFEIVCHLMLTSEFVISYQCLPREEEGFVTPSIFAFRRRMYRRCSSRTCIASHIDRQTSDLSLRCKRSTIPMVSRLAWRMSLLFSRVR